MMQILTALVLLALPLLVPSNSLALPGILLLILGMSLASALERLGLLRRLAPSVWLSLAMVLGTAAAIDGFIADDSVASVLIEKASHTGGATDPGLPEHDDRLASAALLR